MISSTQNPLVKHLVKLRENSVYREEQGKVLLTGHKLIKEISAIRRPLKTFVTDLEYTSDISESITVSQAVMKKITGLSAFDGVAAEFLMPTPTTLTDKSKILVLDAVSDPGNCGTLLRSALALGWDGVFFLDGCVDPFNDKVLRSSRAALFKLPWQKGTWEEIESIKTKGSFTSYIADIEGQNIASICQEKKVLLLLSNESRGVNPHILGFGTKITIPISKEMESLNVAVAGAILMYHLKNLHTTS